MRLLFIFLFLYNIINLAIHLFTPKTYGYQLLVEAALMVLFIFGLYNQIKHFRKPMKMPQWQRMVFIVVICMAFALLGYTKYNLYRLEKQHNSAK